MDLCHRLAHQRPADQILYEPRAKVHHFVPDERTTWRYFWRRCFFVNKGKVEAFRLMEDAADLSADFAFVSRALSTVFPGPSDRRCRAIHGVWPGPCPSWSASAWPERVTWPGKCSGISLGHGGPHSTRPSPQNRKSPDPQWAAPLHWRNIGCGGLCRRVHDSALPLVGERCQKVPHSRSPQPSNSFPGGVCSRSDRRRSSTASRTMTGSPSRRSPISPTACLVVR